jgi:Ca-activated chloride channel family protein
MSKFFSSVFSIILLASLAFAQESQNVGKLNLIAADKSNNPIADLKKDELTLLLGGKPQTLISLEKQESPLIYALAVDSSASLKPVFRDIQNAAKSIVNQSRANDEATLINFIGTDQIFEAKGFSSDKSLLTKAIDDFEIQGGQTAVIDAVYLTIKKVGEYKREDKTRPRAVILVTDGDDRDSYYSEKALFDLIENDRVPVFVIGLVYGLDASTQFSVRSARARATAFIKKVADKSGGAALFSKNLPEAVNQIISLLRNQYVVSYSPSAEAKGKSSEIEIKLAKDSKRKDLKFYVR